MMTPSPQEIRAVYDQSTIRVYQAYSESIANAALTYGTFVSPPFKLDRMTWIKPSFLWMMYRAGWGYKDEGQSKILAIDITRDGFDWAVLNGCLSHPDPAMTPLQWAQHKNQFPVRIQWDPERDLQLRPLQYKAIQIGLGPEAVRLYVNQWIQKITDVTPLAHSICQLVNDNRLPEARSLLPNEKPYPYPRPQ